MKNYSPLRYPGGKGQMYKTIENIILNNNLIGCTYVEPYAGGASVALNLLFYNIVDKIILNDFDRSIFCVWDSILNNTEEFIRLIIDTPVTIEEWEKQKKIYLNPESNNLELGFATFFLNRTNRSGIIKAGPIGGRKQNGNYLISCRFNKKDLIKKIKKISSYKKKIKIYNIDALKLINKDFGNNIFFFFDPPYYKKGSQLYNNHYSHNDHVKMANEIKKLNHNIKWIVTYDDVNEIKEIYKDYIPFKYKLNYSVETKRKGSEIMFANKELII